MEHITLTHVNTRLSRLENEVMELRQLVSCQVPHLAYVTDHEAYTSSDVSDGSELSVAKDTYWQVTCLGIFRLRCADRDLAPCKSRRGQSILKYLLASSGYTASAEALMECFWPQADPVASKRNLQAAVHALRCSLQGCGPNGDDETVLFRNDCYLLNPALCIVQDTNMFRSAYQRGKISIAAGSFIESIQAFEEARSCYTGDFLADSYEEWVFSHRLALQDMRLSLLSHLGSLYSQGKKWEAAISCYQEILAVDGCREDICRQLMLCYAASGRPADIKRAYRCCQKRLRSDLCLAPAPETTALYQQLI